MQGGSPARERWLALAEESFVPPDSGGRVETLNFLRGLTTHGILLHVVVPGVAPHEEERHRKALPGVPLTFLPRRTGAGAHLSSEPYVFASRPLSATAVKELSAAHAKQRFDAIVAVTFRTAALGVELARRLGLPLLIRPHNVESAYFERLARTTGGLRELAYRVEAAKLRRAEAAIHRSMRVTAFADLAYEDAQWRRSRTARPVVHIPPFLPQRSLRNLERRPDGETVLFLGSLDNAHNLDGLQWLLATAWPDVLERRPSTRLHVVGRRPPHALVETLANVPNATLTADAPDLGPHLARATVFVNPTRQGAGINIKMIDAMAAGLPVVSTATGSRGLPWAAGHHLLVADDPAEFTAAVVTLLTDQTACDELAAAGRAFVLAELETDRLVERLRFVMAQSTSRRYEGG